MLSSISISLSCLSNKTPMALLVTTILNSVVVAYLTFKSSMEVWVSVLLLMVYVSGLMVLFMYIISLSPMSMNKSNKKAMVMVLAALLTTQVWAVNYMMTKEMKSFSYAFEKFAMVLAMVTIMMVVMASIIPSISMVSFKGLKSST